MRAGQGLERRSNATAIVSNMGAIIAFGWSHTYAWAFRDLGMRAGQEAEGDVGRNTCNNKCLDMAAFMELIYGILFLVLTLPIWVRIIIPNALASEGEDKPPPPPPKPVTPP